MVLFLFVIMLLNLSGDSFEGISVRRTTGGAIAFGLICLILAAVLAWRWRRPAAAAPAPAVPLP